MMLRGRKVRALHFTRVCDERGQSLVEFALLSVILLPLLVGIVTFGITFNNQITLTNAVNNAAQVLALGSGQITDPCSSANNALYQAASSLNNKNIYGSNPLSFSISAYTNPTTPNTVGPYQVVFSSSGGPSCTSENPDLKQGQQVSITATYGCNLTIYGVNYWKNCVLTATTSEAVQ